MTYAVEMEMSTGVMIYIPSSVKTGSGIEKLTGGEYTDTQHGDRISLLLFLFFKIRNLLVDCFS
jgi:hypothetical protein